MNLDQLIGRLKSDAAFMDCVTEWRTLPAAEGSYVPLPDSMDERLQTILRKRGIHRLYCHQAECWELAQQKKDYVEGGLDRGILTINEAREVYQLPALPAEQGDRFVARGEYYFIQEEEGENNAGKK